MSGKTAEIINYPAPDPAKNGQIFQLKAIGGGKVIDFKLNSPQQFINEAIDMAPQGAMEKLEIAINNAHPVKSP